MITVELTVEQRDFLMALLTSPSLTIPIQHAAVAAGLQDAVSGTLA